MKKTLTIMALVAGAASYVQAQGTVILNNQNASYFVSTNTTSIGGTKGVTTLAANSFYYAVLDSSTALADNPLTTGWSGAVLTGVNLSSPAIATFAGGITGQGGGSGQATTGFSAPASSTYASGAGLEYYIVVGWSANMGTSWSTVSSELTGGNTPAGALYGYSAVGDAYGGGGPDNLPAVSLFGVSTGAPGGLTSGFALTPVPEPSTIALGVMGACSLLALRRKKA
jgi:hypothetical protein